MTAPIRIARLVDLEAAGSPSAPLLASIDAIFAETTRRGFADTAARDAFYDLWLGQYLEHDRARVFVALDAAGNIVGYVAGSLDNPARSDRYPGLGYFHDFATACERYPAHLHINLTALARGQKIGARLIEAFCATAKAGGASGVHVVTGANERNVGFYLRNGFREVACADWLSRPLLCLGRDL